MAGLHELTEDEARYHVHRICTLAEALIRTAAEFDDAPDVCEDYLTPLEDAMMAYRRACAGEEGQCAWQLSCPRDAGHPPPHYYVRDEASVDWVPIAPPRYPPILPPFEA